MRIISIIGEKKSGKTYLIQYLIPYLKEYGKVGCIKHAQYLDIDATLPGNAATAMKDTNRFLSAGADVVIGTSPIKTIKIGEVKKLKELIEEMAKSGVDFLIVEGFKSSNLPKIALSNFYDENVTNIIKRMNSKEEAEEKIKEIVSIILSLEDYDYDKRKIHEEESKK